LARLGGRDSDKDVTRVALPRCNVIHVVTHFRLGTWLHWTMHSATKPETADDEMINFAKSRYRAFSLSLYQCVDYPSSQNYARCKLILHDPNTNTVLPALRRANPFQ
jgi:hypothetical protein